MRAEQESLLTGQLAKIIEHERPQIAASMLQPAREALMQRSLGLSRIANTFLDHLIETLRTREFENLLDWVATLRTANELEEIPGILKTGCTLAARAYEKEHRTTEASELLVSLSAGIERIVKTWNSERTSEEDRVTALVEAQLAMLEARDLQTGCHSREVGVIAGRIAAKMGFSEERQVFTRNAAMLHDIGKISTAERILLKPASLSPIEWSVMKNHAAAGAEILEKLPDLRQYAPIVRAHHERIDGGGYPFGLRGSDIPIVARIVAVADTFHAMVSARPYRDARSPFDALQELLRVAGTQLDAEIVDVMVDLFARESNVDFAEAVSV